MYVDNVRERPRDDNYTKLKAPSPKLNLKKYEDVIFFVFVDPRIIPVRKTEIALSQETIKSVPIRHSK